MRKIKIHGSVPNKPNKKEGLLLTIKCKGPTVKCEGVLELENHHFAVINSKDWFRQEWEPKSRGKLYEKQVP